MADLTERQAQVAVECGGPLTNINLKLHQTLNTKNRWTSGCVTTTDGKLLLTDCHSKCLVGIDIDTNPLFALYTVPYYAFDVTCINDTTVALTSGINKLISIVDISRPKQAEKKHIDVGYKCYGVTYRDGTLLLCAEDHGILSINLASEKISTIVQCDDLPEYSYITTYKDKLYYTNNTSATVTCCDMEGNTLWTFKDDGVLCSPRGITTDKEGRVYVCDKVKEKVIVLSPEGTISKTIVDKTEGLNYPYAIHFDKTNNNIIVANRVKKVFIFRIFS